MRIRTILISLTLLIVAIGCSGYLVLEQERQQLLRDCARQKAKYAAEDALEAAAIVQP